VSPEVAEKASARRERTFRAYAYTLGASATLVALWDTTRQVDALRANLLPIAAFSLLTGFAWYLSFSIFPRASLSSSLDRGYLMTALCALPRPLPTAVAFGGAILGCWLRRHETRSRKSPFLVVMGLNVGSLVTTALAGEVLALNLAPWWDFRHLSWHTVAVLGALFLLYNLVNLGLMGAAVALRG
jgi:hypothetical protein